MRYQILGILFLLFSSFTTTNQGSYLLKVNLEGDDFEQVSEELFNSIEFGNSVLDKKVFKKALKGYCYLRFTDQLQNPKYLTVIDFKLSSNKKRLWLIDIEKKAVVLNELVAHGKYTGTEFAKYFSNQYNSRKTSLGFYVTGEIYNGKHRLSLKLRGKEKGFNSNAFARGIVFHGADYVTPKFAENNKHIGRSFGCPAVSQTVNKELVSLIKEGSCVYFYYPSERYLNQSNIINNSLYIPYEQLVSLLD